MDDVDVYFNLNRVSLARFQPVDRMPQSALDDLGWRAKRQWRKWFP
jgi:hypothetical protein